MLTHLLLAAIGALGVFMLVTAPLWGRNRQNLKRIERLSAEEAEETYGSFTETLRKRGLGAALAQAELPVTRAGFLRFGLVLAAISAGATHLLTGSIIVPLFVGMASILIYLQWLFWRRDSLRVAYEEALADLCDRMATGAQLSNTLEGMLIHAAELAPDSLKSDFTQIANDLAQGASPGEVFARVRERRKSQALDLLLDTLLMWHSHGTTRPLAEVISPLRQSIRELSAERRKLEAELTLPRLQMLIVAVAPFGFVLLLRLSMPAIGRIYASPLGELIQVIAYSISAVGVVLGERAMGAVRKVLETEG